MNRYLEIPLTLNKSNPLGYFVFAKAPIELAIKEFIDLMISTRKGECVFDNDFGFPLFSNEFEPILNVMEWQPIIIEQIKNMLEKYENRITDIKVNEPEITSLNKVTNKHYKITFSLDYTIKYSGERHQDVRITFEY